MSPWPHGRRLHEDEQGLVAALWALGFVGLLAFFAIVIESGLVFMEKRQLQNTADAAALAGAASLMVGETDATLDARAWADKNTSALADNDALVFSANYLRSDVGRNASGIFNGPLSFGRPLVEATATARLAETRLPGPGVFCIAIGFEDYDEAASFQAGNPPPAVAPVPEPYYVTLRYGSGEGSNAGYIDIDGGGSNEVRNCFEQGSSTPLEPEEETETGISTGPGLQGLQPRLEAAMDRGCFTWDEVQQSIADWEADPKQPWRCSPLTDQRTAVVLIPVVWEDFTNISGNEPIHVYDGMGEDAPYLLAFFWIDTEATFDTGPGKWKFKGGGQGHGEIVGVFIVDHPVALAPPPEGGGWGGIVDCDRETGVACFLQLVD